MTFSGFLNRWSGTALRHIPTGSPFDVLDFRYAGRGAENRWNVPGTPTLYLAGDEGVLLAEWGRHFDVSRTARLQQMTVERSTFALAVSVDRALDLRSDAVCRILCLEDAPICFSDTEVVRATAEFVRRTTEAQALLVPSMGFLDDLSRWCLVLFLEKLPPDPKRFITAVTPRGPLRWG
jgi:RES domain-containing protein